MPPHADTRPSIAALRHASHAAMRLSTALPTAFTMRASSARNASSGSAVLGPWAPWESSAVTARATCRGIALSLSWDDFEASRTSSASRCWSAARSSLELTIMFSILERAAASGLASVACSTGSSTCSQRGTISSFDKGASITRAATRHPQVQHSSIRCPNQLCRTLRLHSLSMRTEGLSCPAVTALSGVRLSVRTSARSCSSMISARFKCATSCAWWWTRE
mmetsp:Transcript_13011/g.29707  ORF Transcript_13011/g.29707 Transcript_13011/m.29707 type:complete len:222 (+) Transcript_13011:351-1016(+)